MDDDIGTESGEPNDKSLPKLAYSVDELAAATGIGRTRIYEAIGKVELIAHKYGRRTVILADNAHRWMKTFKVLDLNA